MPSRPRVALMENRPAVQHRSRTCSVYCIARARPWGCDSSEAEDYSDEDTCSRSDEEEESSTGTPSFAQFSVYGTALMCKQREEDSMIVTDFKGTASLCQEDETITTDNRSRSHDYVDELEHGIDQC